MLYLSLSCTSSLVQSSGIDLLSALINKLPNDLLKSQIPHLLANLYHIVDISHVTYRTTQQSAIQSTNLELLSAERNKIRDYQSTDMINANYYMWHGDHQYVVRSSQGSVVSTTYANFMFSTPMSPFRDDHISTIFASGKDV